MSVREYPRSRARDDITLTRNGAIGLDGVVDYYLSQIQSNIRFTEYCDCVTATVTLSWRREQNLAARCALDVLHSPLESWLVYRRR